MAADGPRVLNFNVGILGHVDSGKTSLAKALSTHTSTACFDKNPQSQERGITLDLGFSSFQRPAPPPLRERGYDAVQYTLVDCPGHASLIKTVIGGAQIIDMMILVIDITKGIQTQTAECIVIGEILERDLVVVLNKVDAVRPTETATVDQQVEKTKKRMKQTFAKTQWTNAPLIVTSANPNAGAGGEEPPIGLDALIEELEQRTLLVPNAGEARYEDLIFSIDHCFPIKGHGTVLTGTLMGGTVRVGQMLEFPDLKVQKKVKSIQVFKKPVQVAHKGDRVGICVTQLDSTALERGIACAAGPQTAVREFHTAIARVRQVRFYKSSILSNSKVHLTVGHATVMATVRFFTGPPDGADTAAAAEFDMNQQYAWVRELQVEDPAEPRREALYCILFLDHAVATHTKATLIASKLDVDVHSPTCRMMFAGHVVKTIQGDEWKTIQVIKRKLKTAQIDRVTNEYSAVARGLVVKGGDISRFVGLKIHYQPTATLDPVTCPPEVWALPTYEGVLEGTFGQSGKFTVRFRDEVFQKKGKGKKGAAASEPTEEETGAAAGGGEGKSPYTLALHFVVNQFDKGSAMVPVPPPRPPMDAPITKPALP